MSVFYFFRAVPPNCCHVLTYAEDIWMARGWEGCPQGLQTPGPNGHPEHSPSKLVTHSWQFIHQEALLLGRIFQLEPSGAAKDLRRAEVP